MSRQTGWDYERRYTDTTYAGLAYSMELAGPQGAHFHFWVPRTTFAPRTAVKLAKIACRNQRDLVSSSWDWIPETPAQPV